MEVKKKPCDGEICNGKLAFIWKNVVEDGERLRFCQGCWNKKNSKEKPTIKRQEIKRSTTPIKKFSDRRAKENAAYSVLRKVFLKDHPFCQLSIKDICTKVSTDIQHKRGRLEYFLDTTTWASSCRACHTYANDHPQEAIENGWAELRLKNYENE